MRLSSNNHMLIWFSSINHIEISSLYFYFSLCIGVLAFFFSFIIRLSLIWPFGFINNGEIYLSFVTLHAVYMIFFFVMPFSIGGLVNYLLPLFFVNIDMICPRLNNLSFWLLFFAFIISIFSSILGKGVFSGWTLYPPLSSAPFSFSISGDLIIFSLHMAGLSSILSSINFISSMFSFHLKFSSLSKNSIFIIAQFIIAFLLLISLPVLAAAITLLLFDRNFNTSFFVNAAYGDNLLYQHLFWFFGHPEVYVLILPSFALIAHCQMSLSNSFSPFGYLGLSGAIVSIGLLGCLVWAHHMFTSGMDLNTRLYFSFTTLIIAIPTGIKVFSWVYAFFNRVLIYSPLYVWVLAFVYFFTIGGLTGLILANSQINNFFHDTYYVVAHFHYVLSLGAVIGVWMSIFFYFPYLFNLFTSYKTQIITFLLFFIGANFVFFPLHFLGIWGLPRHYLVFDLNFYCFTLVSSFGMFLLLLSIIYIFNSIKFNSSLFFHYFFKYDTVLSLLNYKKSRSIYFFPCLYLQ